jgi:hypothetical protein
MYVTVHDKIWRHQLLRPDCEAVARFILGLPSLILEQKPLVIAMDRTKT